MVVRGGFEQMRGRPVTRECSRRLLTPTAATVQLDGCASGSIYLIQSGVFL